MKEKTYPVISTNPADLDVPGVQVEFTADEAERWGAFEETAMSEEDAWESNADLALTEPDGGKNVMPCFVPDDEGPSDDIPPFITTTNISELYGWKPGETLKDTIARKKAEKN